MKTVLELEQEIQQIKASEKQAKLLEKLDKAVERTGKGYATHSLNTYMNSGKASFNFKCFFVHRAFIKEDNINYEIELFEFTKLGEDYNIKVETRDYYTEVPYWMGHFRYDMSIEQLKQFKHNFIPKLETAIDELRFDIKANSLISMGDFQDIKSKHSLLLNAGNSFIDMKEFPKVWEILRWNHHPFLYEEHLLNNAESISIIKNIADTMYSNAISWGGSIYSRDKPRVEALNNFYNTHKKS